MLTPSGARRRAQVANRVARRQHLREAILDDLDTFLTTQERRIRRMLTPRADPGTIDPDTHQLVSVLSYTWPADDIQTHRGNVQGPCFPHVSVATMHSRERIVLKRFGNT